MLSNSSLCCNHLVKVVIHYEKSSGCRLRRGGLRSSGSSFRQCVFHRPTVLPLSSYSGPLKRAPAFAVWRPSTKCRAARFAMPRTRTVGKAQRCRR